MSTNKNILLIFCGGTISMKKNPITGALDVEHGPDQLFELEPRIVDVATITTEYVTNIDSTNMVPADWTKIGETIKRNYDQYDGFVVTMGTNTLAYASSALSFAIQNLGKPVVFTGAQIPAEAISTDARNNLLNALRVSVMDLSGVFVVFGSKIISGSRAKKIAEADLDAFETFNDSDFGEVSIGIKINKKIQRRHDKTPIFKTCFNENILSLTCIPGFNIKYLEKVLDDGVEGIILRGYGTGDISYDYLPIVENAKKKEVPVIVTTQCRSSTLMGVNDPGFKALEAGVIQGYDMSMESMATKLMWLLADKTPYVKFKELFHLNMTGEINIKPIRFFY